jgi:kynureninase
MRVGTPPVVWMAILDAALDTRDRVDVVALRARFVALTEQFIRGVEARCPRLELARSCDPAQPGPGSRSVPATALRWRRLSPPGPGTSRNFVAGRP